MRRSRWVRRRWRGPQPIVCPCLAIRPARRLWPIHVADHGGKVGLAQQCFPAQPTDLAGELIRSRDGMHTHSPLSSDTSVGSATVRCGSNCAARDLTHSAIETELLRWGHVPQDWLCAPAIQAFPRWEHADQSCCGRPLSARTTQVRLAVASRSRVLLRRGSGGGMTSRTDTTMTIAREMRAGLQTPTGMPMSSQRRASPCADRGPLCKPCPAGRANGVMRPGMESVPGRELVGSGHVQTARR